MCKQVLGPQFAVEIFLSEFRGPVYLIMLVTMVNFPTSRLINQWRLFRLFKIWKRCHSVHQKFRSIQL